MTACCASRRAIGRGGPRQPNAVADDTVALPFVAYRVDQFDELVDEVQRIAVSEVPYVPWGQWSPPTAFRKRVRDVLKFAAPIFWNVKLA